MAVTLPPLKGRVKNTSFCFIINNMLERDNIHFNFRSIDGLNKTWNFVICERDVGKTFSLEMDKIWMPFVKYRRRCCYLVRKSVEITEDLIKSMEIRMNRFLKEPLEFLYVKNELREGVVSIYIIYEGKKELLMKIVALSIDLERLKKITIDNIDFIIQDELVCNPRLNEKYVKGEAFKIMELFNTLQRFAYEKGKLKYYGCGNPYSKYIPLIAYFNVNTRLMKQGARVVGDDYVIDCYDMLPALRKKILQENPLYKFDNSYKEYAFNGEYVNDRNIRIASMPDNYYLRFVFNIDGVYIGIYKNDFVNDRADRYYVKKIKYSEVRKTSYCFSFDDLVEGSILMSGEERSLFNRFKICMRKRLVEFESEECYYLSEEIYKNL